MKLPKAYLTLQSAVALAAYVVQSATMARQVMSLQILAHVLGENHSVNVRHYSHVLTQNLPQYAFVTDHGLQAINFCNVVCLKQAARAC